TLGKQGELYLKRLEKKFTKEGEYDNEVYDKFTRALNIYEGIGDKYGEAVILCNLGEYWQYQDKQERALKNFEKSIELFEAIGAKGAIEYNKAIKFRDKIYKEPVK
ncbi:MAG: tetratricopeptide repeat protein, partial [Planctomycetota bacterium]